MPSPAINISDFIEDIKTYNTSHGLSTDISGIVIFDVNIQSGVSWDIRDSNTGIYELEDISDAVYTNAYFLPYSELLSLQLNYTTESNNNYIDFYLITSEKINNFSTPRVNLNSLSSSIDANVIYRIFNDYMSADKIATEAWRLIDPIIITPPATAETVTTATLPNLSSYTPAQVNSLFDTRDSSLRVIEIKSEQTIAAEVKKYLNTNGALPQFKNYGDYLAYKNAINLQNGLLQRYG